MGLNILVVDDSESTRALMVRTLRASGLPIGEIHEAANGAEGLVVLQREKVDVLMVDLNMPVMGGVEMIECVRRDPELAGLPILVVSGEFSKALMEVVGRQGVAFVQKPFTSGKIREVLWGLLGEWRGRDGGPGRPGDRER